MSGPRDDMLFQHKLATNSGQLRCQNCFDFRILDLLQMNYKFAVLSLQHDDVIKWKHFPRHWPCVRGINRSPVNSPHKGQWRGALMFPLVCVWINDWVNNRGAGDLKRHRAHYDVTVMRAWESGQQCYFGTHGYWSSAIYTIVDSN